MFYSLQIVKIYEYWTLKTVVTPYFCSSHTKYTLIFINKHRGNHFRNTTEADIYSLFNFCYWGYSQSAPK